MGATLTYLCLLFAIGELQASDNGVVGQPVAMEARLVIDLGGHSDAMAEIEGRRCFQKLGSGTFFRPPSLF